MFKLKTISMYCEHCDEYFEIPLQEKTITWQVESETQIAFDENDQPFDLKVPSYLTTENILDIPEKFQCEHCGHTYEDQDYIDANFV